MNVIHTMNQLKKKNHVSNSINAKRKKHLTVLPPFQIIPEHILERNFFNPIKGISEKTTNNVVLMVENQMISP